MGLARTTWAFPPALCWLLLCHTLPISAETLEVPDDYETIQEAIDAAEVGDTVLVAAGTYVENIDFLGKDITVVSVDGAEDTTIDGSDATSGLDSASVVRFADDETASARLEGFTLTGGTGSDAVAGSGAIVSRGGGVFADDSSPTIVDCIITANEHQGVYGNNASFTLEGCVIAHHDASGVECYGLYSVTLRDCHIEDNESTYGTGGVRLRRDFRDPTCDLETSYVEGCTFLDNSGFLSGHLEAHPPVEVRDCVFDGGNGLIGGGMAGMCDSEIHDSVFVNNDATWGGAISGPDSGDASMHLERCLIANNTAWKGAGLGLGGSISPEITLVHCTLVGNEADVEGGAVRMAPHCEASVTLENCIMWGNGDDEIEEGSGSITATYSCTTDGLTGTGNIDDDPLFLDTFTGDYHLDPDSPCIDAGNPDSPADLDDTTADMGRYYFNQAGQEFARGDADGSGTVSAIPDALFLFAWGFLEGPEPGCAAAADADGNGSLNALTDPLYLLRWNFGDGDVPPDPGPDECGTDPEDGECEVEPDCP